MVYFPEKISLTTFGHIWSCLRLSWVEKWPFCHFSTHDPPKYKNGQKWPKKIFPPKNQLKPSPHSLWAPYIQKSAKSNTFLSSSSNVPRFEFDARTLPHTMESRHHFPYRSNGLSFHIYLPSFAHSKCNTNVEAQTLTG